MNILFISLSYIDTLNNDGIYIDLIKEFAGNGHQMYVVSPAERRRRLETKLHQEGSCKILTVKTGNIQKTNMIEKGISTMLLEHQMKSAIRKYYGDVTFDVVIYATPPITLFNVVSFVKKRDHATTYLLLKDIFPQNAVDLNLFSQKSIFYLYFRRMEKNFYKISDYIGCMSQANVDYVLAHNKTIDPKKVHVSPNSIACKESIPPAPKENIREQYNIPKDATVFLYGGNLGKPQGISFVIDCLKQNQNKSDRFFIVCGTGTEYGQIKAYMDANKPQNVLLINGLPRREYDQLVAACDVGLLFLDHRFTIPNFPSRMLAYLQAGMPVLACTDANTDIGKVIVDGQFGWWCESKDPDHFTALVSAILEEDIASKGANARTYLKQHYTAKHSYDIVMQHIK